MEVIRLVVSKRNIECVKNNLIDVIGDNADYEARFVFDGEWAGKIKTARFVNPRTNRYKDVVLENDTCIIPVEMLKKGFLNIGVFCDVMTTKPCEVLVRESIKDKTGAVQPPTEDVYGQIMALLNDIEMHKLVPVEKTDEMTQAVGRDVDGKLYTWPTGGGGGGTADHRQLEHRDAVNQHPMSAIEGLTDALDNKQPVGDYLTSETDPTVPEWAKQPSKPTYTASEVNALPDDTMIPNALADLTDDATHRLVTDSEKITWDGKQDAIDDLAVIRSDASAGKTASDNLDGHTVAKDVPSDAAFTDTIYDDTALAERVSTIENKESTWDAKYSKPSDGIPDSDLESTFLKSSDITGKEDSTNKVTSISSSSTDTEYPLAKCVYDIVGNIESALAALR